MTRSASTRGRVARFVVIAGLVAASCGSDGPPIVPVAEVSPGVEAACIDADRALAALSDGEAARETFVEVQGVLRDLTKALPSDVTDLGSVSNVVGLPVRRLSRAMSDVGRPYENLQPLEDRMATEQEIGEALAEVNDSAARFDVDGCLDPMLGADLLVPQIDVAVAFLDEIAPTGDFSADVAAACERYRVAEAAVLVDNATDPNAQFLIFGRLRGLVEGFATDLERFDPPPDDREELAAMLASIEAVSQSVSSVESARLASQDALDDAQAEFDVVIGEFEQQIETLSPGC